VAEINAIDTESTRDKKTVERQMERAAALETQCLVYVRHKMGPQAHIRNRYLFGRQFLICIFDTVEQGVVEDLKNNTEAMQAVSGLSISTAVVCRKAHSLWSAPPRPLTNVC
jgi:hypothetical protein